MKETFFEAPGLWGSCREVTLWVQGGDGGALFNFLLGAQVVGVAELLVAVDSTGMQVGTLEADRLVVVVLLSELAEGGLNDATPQTKHKGQGGFFECCNLRECSHPSSVCPHRSDAAGQAGCPPCLGFYCDILNGSTSWVMVLPIQGLHKDLHLAGEAGLLAEKEYTFLWSVLFKGSTSRT